MNTNPITDHDIEQALQDIRPLAEPGPGLRGGILARVRHIKSEQRDLPSQNHREPRRVMAAPLPASRNRGTGWLVLFATGLIAAVLIFLIGMLGKQDPQEAGVATLQAQLTPVVASTPEVLIPGTLLGTTWDLVEINGQEPPPGMSMEFTSGLEFAARTVCSTGWGDYDISSGTIGRMTDLVTRPDCTGDEPSWTDQYFTELGYDNPTSIYAQYLVQTGDDLEIFNDEGVRTLRFKYRKPEVSILPSLPMLPLFSAPGPDLTGTSWDVVTLRGTYISTLITLEFDSPGKFSGKVCNYYHGDYTQQGQQITFNMGASTLMACGDGEENRLESKYQHILSSVARAEIIQGVLHLFAADGTLLVTLFPLPF